MNPYRLIDKYYAPGSELYHILVTHSQNVTQKALTLAKHHEILQGEKEFIESCSMLHDIGIFMTNAPSIDCYGTYQYIEHGYLGGILLDIVKRSIPIPIPDVGGIPYSRARTKSISMNIASSSPLSLRATCSLNLSNCSIGSFNSL